MTLFSPVAFHARSLRALEETRAFGGITQWFRRFLYQVPICGDTGEDARIYHTLGLDRSYLALLANAAGHGVEGGDVCAGSGCCRSGCFEQTRGCQTVVPA